MKKFIHNLLTFITKLVLVFSLFNSTNSFTAEIEITLVNTTTDQVMLPLIVSAHTIRDPIFKTNTLASPELALFAQSGAISQLESRALLNGASVAQSPAGKLIYPNDEKTLKLFTTPNQSYLSLVAQIVPEYNTFVGLENFQIPALAGTYQLDLSAYQLKKPEVVDESTADAAYLDNDPAVEEESLGLIKKKRKPKVHFDEDELDANSEDLAREVPDEFEQRMNSNDLADPVAKLILVVKN